MIKKHPEDCCGCTACACACPKHAISMIPDALGFLYPRVNDDLCIKCGLCLKVCSFHKDYDISRNMEEPVAYGVRHKDLNEVMKSRSGAAFVALSDYVLDRGGVVYGAGYKEHFKVAHKRAVSKKERDEFRGSKYVQSDLTGIFPQVKQDLKQGLIVLFSGTPCQTSGLNNFIGKKYREQLILVDIVCHGVPSPYIWKDFLDYIEKKYHRVITDVCFRDKEQYGWRSHKETFSFGERKITPLIQYNYTFYKNIMLRRSCGNCYFCNTSRPSDFTLADFWGWEKSCPKMNDDNKGISLLLCNTKNSLKIFNEVKSLFEFQSVQLNNCLQPNLQRPSEISVERDAFEREYVKKGFDYTMKKYGDLGFRLQFAKRMMILKLKLKNKIKKVFK